jgi:hypothetical protein
MGHILKSDHAVSAHPDPSFATLAIGERRFLKCWTLSQIHYAIKRHNRINGTTIKIKCTSVAGSAKYRVAPGIIMERVK